ncbi:MAG: tetratricopeptide repeat protein [Massilia sp.]
MRPTVKTLSAACASALLVACADMGHFARQAAPVRPGVSADEAYVLARQQHMASRLPAAIDSYQTALRADPHHINATNGLATLYAEQGNLPKAIGMWRELALDVRDSPATAFIHSNLGYAYHLNGDFQLAISELERACVLDPLSHRAWRHLGDALGKVGQDERASRMLRQAESLEQHDLRGDYALMGTTPPAAATDIDAALLTAAKAAPVTAVATVAEEPAPASASHATVDDWPRTEIRQTGSAMFELHRSTAASTAARPAKPAKPAPVRPDAPVPVATEVVAAKTEALEEEVPASDLTVHRPPPPVANKPDEEVIEPPARVEIRNGNGITGMARSLSGAIADDSTRVVRLSNQKGFKVERTRVEYQPGFAYAAEKLAERFGGEAVQAAPGGNIDMRLVLGRDLARSKSEARRIIRAALARAARAG